MEEKKKIPKFPAALKRGFVKCPICAKDVGQKKIEEHFIRRHRDSYETHYGIAVPNKTSCDYPDCEAAFPIAKDVADHRLIAHGVENKARLIDLAQVGRMSISMLNFKYADEARVLNFLNRTVSRLEAHLSKNIPLYDSSHGLDISGTWYEALPSTPDTPRAAQALFTAQGLMCIRAHALQGCPLPNGGNGTRTALIAELHTQVLRLGAADKDVAAETDEMRNKLELLVLTLRTEPGLDYAGGFLRRLQLVEELEWLVSVFSGTRKA